MRYLVVAGGTPDDLPESAAVLGQFDMIVCADGGVYNARRLGLSPDVVVGDMDSLGEQDRALLQATGCRILVHPVAKDETDLELALLWCRDDGAHDVTVVGGLGGRPDHALANQLLLADQRFRTLNITLRSREWAVQLSRGDTWLHGKIGDTVSLIPLSERVSGVVTDGLLYPLRNETLRRGPARGVSNSMLAPDAHVHFERGLLFVMHGPDQGAH
jgi:thiamine pyrophosphokinase